MYTEYIVNIRKFAFTEEETKRQNLEANIARLENRLDKEFGPTPGLCAQIKLVKIFILNGNTQD